MHVAVEAVDVGVADADLEAVRREVRERFTSSLFAGVRDLRLRLRSAKGALLCVAVVGFAGGELVTSTATSDTPLTAMVGALDGLPDRIDRIHRVESAPASLDHASVRAELKRLLDRV
jgi:hypothetical protein